MLVTNSISGAMENADVKVEIRVSKDRLKLQGEPYTMLFQKLGVVTAKNIRPVTAKVLLYLCAVVNYGNSIDKGSEQIGEELGYSPRNILRALKELEELKIIFRQNHPQNKKLTVIYLNPFHSWTGRVMDRKKKIAAHDPDQLQMFPDYKSNQHSLLRMSPKTLEESVSVANADKK